MKRLSSPLPTLSQAVSLSAYFYYIVVKKPLRAFLDMLSRHNVNTGINPLLYGGLLGLRTTQSSEKKPSMKYANTFTTNSDLQVIFIQGSKKVLIECSEHFVNRYHLKEYVYIMSYEDFKVHIHEDDISLIHFFNCPSKHHEDTRFRLRLPEQEHYVTFFHRGYYDLDGGIGFLAFDISHVDYLREQLRQRELEYLRVVEETQRVLNYGRDLVVKLSVEGTILSVSQEALAVFGTEEDEVLGLNIYDLDEQLKHGEDWVQEVLQQGKITRQVSTIVQSKRIVIEWIVEAITSDQGDILYLLVVGRELTDLVEKNEQLIQEKNYDRLTGALSKNGILESMLQHPPEEAWVYYLKLNHLNQYEHYYGQSFSEAILKQVYDRLSSSLPAPSRMARYGDQSFLITIEEHQDEPKAIQQFFKLLQERPIKIEQTVVNLHLVTGLAHFPQDDATLEQVIAKSLLASQYATSGSISRYQMGMSRVLNYNKTMLERMQEALIEDRFEIHFQEIRSLQHPGVEMVEALARWEDSVLGRVPPDVFIHKARQANWLDKLEKHLIEKSFYRYAQLRENSRFQNTKLSLNLTSEMFLSDGLASILADYTNRFKILPQNVIIEISEQTFIHQISLCEVRLNVLREAGYLIALDDFGKEYSSLAVLETIPLDFIKIDGVFTEKIELPLNKEIIRMVKRLGDIKHARVIIEGVETQHQSDILKSLGIDLQQGYYWHKPECF